jgi:quinate dehydrogenase
MGSYPQEEAVTTQTPSIDQYERHGYLFGYPIAHSYSPYLHNTVFKCLDINWGFELLESKDMSLFLKLLKDQRLYGAQPIFPSTLTNLINH